MAVPTTPIRRCTSGKATGGRPCGKKLEGRMIQRAQATEDPSTVIFHKSIAVFLCPRCDTAAQGLPVPIPPPMSSL